MPYSLLEIIVFGPDKQSVDITGVPQNIDSINTFGKPSEFEVKINRSASFIYIRVFYISN